MNNSYDLLNNWNTYLRLDSDISVEEDPNIVFVGHEFILSYLKKLDHYLGLRWIFVLDDLAEGLPVIVLIIKDQ